MEDLTLVGVHDDGEHIVLTGSGGDYRLRVDDALRAAVRRDRARLGQLQIEMDGRLRPRDIQARIRAGQAAEDVAEAAGVPLDYVRRYEGPVLAERQFVAQQARGARVRRSGGVGPTLDAVVTERLVARAASIDDGSWDAWRTDDGSWLVAMRHPELAGDARWTFDPHTRHVTPVGVPAEELSEEEPAQPPPGRRLASVRAPEQAGPAPDDDAGLLLDTLRERRGRRHPSGPGTEAAPPGPDPVQEAIESLRRRSDSLGDPVAPARTRQNRRREPDVVVLPDAEPVPAGPSRRRRSGQAAREGQPTQKPARQPSRQPARQPAQKVTVPPDPDDRRPEPSDAPAERPARGKTRRASVPSWDDIVFGTRRD